MTRHVDGWVILTFMLFAATAWVVAVEIQIVILTLTGQFATVPASQTVFDASTARRITSASVLPQVFFSYLFPLSGLVVADLFMVQRLRKGFHSDRSNSARASTESSQLR